MVRFLIWTIYSLLLLSFLTFFALVLFEGGCINKLLNDLSLLNFIFEHEILSFFIYLGFSDISGFYYDDRLLYVRVFAHIHHFFKFSYLPRIFYALSNIWDARYHKENCCALSTVGFVGNLASRNYCSRSPNLSFKINLQFISEILTTILI